MASRVAPGTSEQTVRRVLPGRHPTMRRAECVCGVRRSGSVAEMVQPDWDAEDLGPAQRFASRVHRGSCGSSVGIMVMSVVTTTVYTGVAVTADIDNGVFDRFRAPPVWRPAPRSVYLSGDVFRYPRVGPGTRFPSRRRSVRGAGVGVLHVFPFAFSRVWTMFGLPLRPEKSIMDVSMMALFPATFPSNILVRPKRCRAGCGVCRGPVTHVAASTRGFMSAVSTRCRRFGRLSCR